MMVVEKTTSLACALFLLAACAPAHPAFAPGSTPSAGSPAATGSPVGAAVATAASSALPGVAPPAVARLPEITLDPKAPVHALPELKVENVGLHIGGGPNDADTKEPFLRAVAARFPEFLDCYRQSEDPGKGGTFGIDLHVPRAGGKAEVSQPRTGMRGAEFRACVVNVFESVAFDKPKRGPTVLSYSLKYSLDSV
ncbi:MAG TPA: hypothetical protein VGI10_07225 [Polyangiaceae bacterium]|jgi:hypothetical protein